jgi:hypothetical protein
MTKTTVHMDVIYSVYINEYSCEICKSCLDNMKTPPSAQFVIDDPLYLTECTLCRALPIMPLQRCLDCFKEDVHPYDQYHAEGFCAE